MGLIGIHPQTLRPIPELATHWAFDEDGKTIYFKLDRTAKWPDGTPITADDYLFTLQFMRSKHIVSPWHNEYYRERIVDIKKFDDYTIAVRGVGAQPVNEKIFDYALSPIQRSFHKLDSNWVKDFNWKAEPSPGPYTVSTIKKGKYIEFSRNKNWWAREHRYFNNRFNPDKIRISVIRDQNLAYKYFTRGELDAFELNSPPLWHDTARGPLYDSGYIHKLWFYHDTPQNRLAKRDADTAPRPSETSRIGSAQQSSVVEEVKSTSQAQRLGVVISSTRQISTLGVGVMSMVVGDVAQIVLIMLVIANGTSRLLCKRSVRKALIEEQLLQLGIGESDAAIGTDEYRARLEVAAYGVNIFDFL